MKQIIIRKNYKFDDRNRSISYDLYITGTKKPERQRTQFLDKKEYFIRRLKGK